jgi:hypothetical protein
VDRDRHQNGRDEPMRDVALAEDWTEALERLISRREHVPRSEARTIAARKAGVPAGKLYSLARGRLKDVSNSVLRGLGGALIRELQQELARVEHDLAIHTQIGDRADSGEVLTLASRREKIREALGLDAPDGQGGG